MIDISTMLTTLKNKGGDYMRDVDIRFFKHTLSIEGDKVVIFNEEGKHEFPKGLSKKILLEVVEAVKELTGDKSDFIEVEGYLVNKF